MPKRSYDQYCPLACALDVLGERWTLLVIRELLAGPKRYTDLRNGLPGVPTDLLTERLRALEDGGILRRRRLPAPAAATVYELTDRGRELEPALFGLARFGVGLLRSSPSPDDPPPPDRLALVLRALFDPDRAPVTPETWILQGSGEGFAVTVSREGIELQPRTPEVDASASARFIGEVPTVFDLFTGRLDTPAALAEGRLRVEGDEAALDRLRAVFS